MNAPHKLQPGDAMPQVDGMLPNPGKLPREAIGKRVTVELRNGRVCHNWAADGQSGCRWTLTNNDWDIAFYEVLK